MGAIKANLTGPDENERRIGQYVLEQKLGEGGMAEVWKARNQILDTCVAIKFLTRRLAGDPETEQRFLGEGKRQAKLRHPNIVSAFDFLYLDGRSYLVMEYIEGESLDDRLYRLQAPMPLPDVLSISRDVLGALGFAHSRDVVHRDIKPSNILIEHTGRSYVMDFGIALVTGEQRLTRAGVSIGTPHYMSPEQIIGAKVIDRRSDIYSFGCVLYEALTLRPPFDIAEGDGDTEYLVKEMHLHKEPGPLRELNPDVPEYVEHAVLRCLEKKADDRFASCEEVLRALTSAPIRRTVPSRTATVVERQETKIDSGSALAVGTQPQAFTTPQTPGRASAQSQTVEPHKPAASVAVAQTATSPPDRTMLWVAGGVLAAAILSAGVYYVYSHRQQNADHTDNGKPAFSTNGTLSVTCNLDCSWVVDGKPQPTLRANVPAVLNLPFGAHAIAASTLDNRDQLNRSFDLSSSNQSVAQTIDLRSVQLARLERANKTTPAPIPPASAVEGEVAAICNLDCDWAIDGQPQTQMRADSPSVMHLPLGTHTITASTLDNLDKVSLPPIDLSSPKQIVSQTIDLKSVQKARLAKQVLITPPAPTTLSGTWRGEYTHLDTNQINNVNLQIAEGSSDLLTGTLIFDPGGKNAATCPVTGNYNSGSGFMMLVVGQCQGRPPNYLQGKIGFTRVKPTDRATRGIDSAHNGMMNISR